MLNINTIAAGGGSIIKLEGSKITVGTESAHYFLMKPVSLTLETLANVKVVV